MRWEEFELGSCRSGRDCGSWASEPGHGGPAGKPAGHVPGEQRKLKRIIFIYFILKYGFRANNLMVKTTNKDSMDGRRRRGPRSYRVGLNKFTYLQGQASTLT